MQTQLSQPDAFASTNSAVELLSAALDNQGHICVVAIRADGRAYQTFFQPGDYEGAVTHAMAVDQQGANAFFCTSTLADTSSRKAQNVFQVRCFKLDLDVGTGPHKYASKREAITGLLQFCNETGLPIPTAVDSGNGAHVYWCLSDALNAQDGKKYSERLKAICIAHGLKIDPAVTGDLARILRVPHTRNRKNPVQPKLVTVKPLTVQHGIQVFSTAELLARLDALHEKLGETKLPTQATGANVLFLPGAEPPEHAHHSTPGMALSELQIHDLRSALLFMRADDRELWVRMGMALKGTGDTGRGLWLAWSATSQSFDPVDAARTWDSFEPTSINYTAVFAEAQRHGWLNPQKNVSVSNSNCSRDEAIATIQQAVERAQNGDVGAPFESQAIAALRTMRETDAPEFQRLRAALKRIKGVRITELDEALKDEMRAEERTSADGLVALAREQCDLFHDADKEPHCTFMQDEHRECWHLYSTGFREWLSHQFYRQCGIAPTEAAMTTALATLAGQAKFEGEERPVAVRVAKHGNDYFIDLCDEQWQAVRVTSAGWQVIQAPPVMFTRNKAMRPLPMPESGGNVDDLWRFANIAPDDRMLVLAFIVESYRPDAPFPILELHAEQGAAKSSTQSILRELIDPNKANLRAKPKTIDDLFVSAKATHVTSLENLSFLSPEYQDALCAVATGAGYGGRTLYTNMDETVFEVKRPVIMNGIGVVATRQDLMDRTLLVHLPSITVRRSESELLSAFDRLKPQLFGALLTLFANTLAWLPNVRINASDLPRMADFAHLGEAMFQAMGVPAGEFLAKYHAKRRYGIEQTIDATPVAAAVMAWLEKNPHGFDGPLKTLYQSLAVMPRTNTEVWPKSERALGESLRRVAPSLRVLGIDVQERGRKKDGCHWKITPQ